MKLFGLYAALCTPAFALAMEDGQRLVKGLVYAQNISPFREQQTAEEKETLEGLRRRVDAIAVQKLEEVLEFAKSSNEFITAAASAAMEHVPETLTWVQWDTTPCFHAQDQQGRLYSINLLRGIVLLDGSPPRRIPSTILQHGLFQRCFGDAVFEVSMDRSGTFKTSRPVDGCFYEFQELSGGQLRISELKDGSSGKSRILLAMFASNYLTFDKMSLSYSIIFYHILSLSSLLSGLDVFSLPFCRNLRPITPSGARRMPGKGISQALGRAPQPLEGRGIECHLVSSSLLP